MISHIASWLITLALLGPLGLYLGRRRTRPAGWALYVALLLAAIAGLSIGGNVILIGVDDVRLYLSRAIFVGCLGGILGLLSTNYRIQRVTF